MPLCTEGSRFAGGKRLPCHFGLRPETITGGGVESRGDSFTISRTTSKQHLLLDHASQKSPTHVINVMRQKFTLATGESAWPQRILSLIEPHPFSADTFEAFLLRLRQKGATQLQIELGLNSWGH